MTPTFLRPARNPDSHRRVQRKALRRRRGLTSTLAMLFLAIAGTLALGMYSASTSATAAAGNLVQGERARNAAETGLRWMSWRFVKMARPKTSIGNITPTVAASLWPNIRSSITTDLSSMLTPAERSYTYDGATLTTAPISVDETSASPTGARFVVAIRQHPLFGGDPLDARYIHVTSTGTYKNARRIMSMDFFIDKKVKFAIVGKVPIQLGRNTLVEGPVGMATPGKYPPIFMLSDFAHLNSTLNAQITSFNAFLDANHKGYDNRINVNDPDEFNKATQAGYADTNGDGYIDEYDLFLKYYDKNNDKAISKAEFTDPSTGQLYDPDLFNAIDSLGAPLSSTDPARAGYEDGVIDNSDAYTKIRGQITLATSVTGWASNLAGQGLTIQDEIQGPISPTDSTLTPVTFGASASDMFDLSPTNFDTSDFLAESGTAAGATQTGGGAQVTITNKTLSASDAQVMKITKAGNTSFHVGDVVLTSDFNAANASLPSSKKATGTNITPANAVEQTPYGSTSYQATYSRPVFKNMHFKNVIIPKGMNALFDNCTFDGVTYVQVTTNITNSSGQTTTSASDGMTWSQRMNSGSFSNNTTLTAANSKGFAAGNNLRFNDCTIDGPIASDVPTAYTHFTNSWEFTGATTFNNQWVDPSSGQTTATIIAPQVNIEMGSFTDPSKAPSTLKGVVVVGNIDIRGSSVVDGSIIVTGDGAGNTTQGWFGPSDANTDPNSPMPQGGYGRLNIRYNPDLALPNGINVAIDITPNIDSYTETQ